MENTTTSNRYNANPPGSNYSPSLAGLISKVLLLFLFLSGLTVQAQTSEAKEYYLKALFMYNSAKYIDWGSYGKQDEFSIGVLGSSPIALPLVALANSEAAGNKKVVIQQFKYPYEISFTNVLFISQNYAFPLSSFLPLLSPGTLTVGEENGSAEDGIAFNLVIDDNRLKFEANVKALALAGLKASAELLQYAMAPIKILPDMEEKKTAAVESRDYPDAAATKAISIRDLDYRGMETKKIVAVRDRNYPGIEGKKMLAVHDRDYPEGVTEEIKTEPKMIIYRTVIRSKNTSVIFQKVAYDWGGTFYFRNSSSISENTYISEIKKAKDTLGKDKVN